VRKRMSDRYINELLLEYEKLRTNANQQAKTRQIEVYKKIPRIKDIDASLRNIGLEIAKAVIKGNDDMKSLIEREKKVCTDLRVEKAELLTKHNFPVDYMEPKYRCPDCQDTGYIGSEKCHCLKQRIIDKHYDQSNIRNILKKENFEMFVFDYYSPHKFNGEQVSPRKNIEDIFKACIEFVNNFDTTSQNLFFYGDSGLGKTFLSNCIAKDLLDKGKLVIYQTSSSLIEILREAQFDNNDTGFKEKLEDVFDCELLIIDDLGTEYITDFSQMELFNLINKRLITQKKMIISTNLSLDNFFNTYPERITSRIFGNFTMFKFYGEDIRIKIAQEKRKKSK
jgi:DNA replication protein DnaC